jgi:hypothetical protein
MLRLPACALAAALLVAACHHKSETPQAAPEAAPTTPGKTGTATINGTVRLTGAPPAPGKDLRASFPDCARFVGQGPADPAAIIAPDGAVKYAFVWVKEGLPPGTYPAPSEPVKLDQRACQFEPRVFGVQVNQPVVLVNSDPMLHNVKTDSFNLPMPTQNMQVTRRFAHPGVPTPFKCDVHGWMHAYAGVVTHPFFAVTSADGKFSLANLPAGTYTVAVWHERLGGATQSVTVADGATGSAEFTLHAP